MLTFKEYITEERDTAKTLAHLTTLANHPSATHGERQAAQHAIHRLSGSKPEKKPEHKKEPEKPKHTDSRHFEKIKMHANDKGERRYVSRHLESGTFKSHNRSETEVKYHPSEKAASEHLKSQGFHHTYYSKSAAATDKELVKKTKTRHTADQFSDSPFMKDKHRYPDSGGRIRGTGK